MGSKALFGRYWKADSPIHRLDPRTKIVGTLLMVITLFLARTFVALGFLAVVLLAIFALARIPLAQALRSIAPLAFIILLTALFNLLFVQGGDVYLDWGWLQVSAEGVRLAAFVALRLALLLLSGSLLTLVTTSFDITEGFERLLAPFARVGLPAHEFALILGLALRFLPQFVDELHAIRAAQVSRGANLATSPFKSGFSALASLLVPLFASVFRHAETLSAAMEARCYHGAMGRTRLRPLRFAGRDGAALATLIAVAAITTMLSFPLP